MPPSRELSRLWPCSPGQPRTRRGGWSGAAARRTRAERREASGEECGSQGGKRREGAKGAKKGERGSCGRRGPRTAGTQEGGKRRPRRTTARPGQTVGAGRRRDRTGGRASASREWEAWRTRLPGPPGHIRPLTSSQLGCSRGSGPVGSSRLSATAAPD